MNTKPLSEVATQANNYLSDVISKLRELIEKKGDLSDHDYESLGNLYLKGEQYRRIVIYYMYKAKIYKFEDTTFLEYVYKYFKTSKSEAYKQVARTKVELQLFNQDESKIGTITNNSLLDHFIRIKRTIYFQKLMGIWNEVQAKSGGPDKVTIPFLREHIKNEYPKLAVPLNDLFFVPEESVDLKKWKEDTGQVIEKKQEEFPEIDPDEIRKHQSHEYTWFENLVFQNNLNKDLFTRRVLNQIKSLPSNELEHLRDDFTTILKSINDCLKGGKTGSDFDFE
jgi:hypothetical protein